MRKISKKRSFTSENYFYFNENYFNMFNPTEITGSGINLSFMLQP